MDRIPNIHPGEVLKLDLLDEYELSPEQLATAIHVTVETINEVIAGKRGIDADLALRLSRYFGMSAEMWINLQRKYDEEEIQLRDKAEYEQIRPIQAA